MWFGVLCMCVCVGEFGVLSLMLGWIWGPHVCGQVDL